MAELHPEECWPGLYRAGQRRQVGWTEHSALYLEQNVIILSSSWFMEITWRSSKGPKDLLGLPVMVWLFWAVGKNLWSDRAVLEWEWGWRTCEFKAPFNTCSSHRDLGNGERLGRRWQELWLLVPLWHQGKSLLIFPPSICQFMSPSQPLSICNNFFCLNVFCLQIQDYFFFKEVTFIPSPFPALSTDFLSVPDSQRPSFSHWAIYLQSADPNPSLI